MPDDVIQPPDTPPGEPTASSEPVASSPAPEKAAAPIFTAEQISQLGAAMAKGIVSAVPPPPAPVEAPPVAIAPPGPSSAELQVNIDQLDAQIDQAVQEGKPIRMLVSQRDQLRDQKFDLERVQPLRLAGANAINELNLDRVRTQDKYFRRYEKEIMTILRPLITNGQALTKEMVDQAVIHVKGRHAEEVADMILEERTRQARLGEEPPMPGSTNGRSRAQQPRTPDTIRERFGIGGEEAFRAKLNKGYTEDSFARRLGHKDKADWFAKDDEMSSPDFNIGLDSYWDSREKRWIRPDELNEFFNR